MWCWGDNSYGKLGDGTMTDRPTPVAVSGLGSGVLTVAAGRQHTCAVTSSGAIGCWGHNGYGQVGDGTTTNRLVPVGVSGLGSVVAAVSAGGYHTCAVTNAGAVWCWGANDNGQIGDGTTYTNRLTPVGVSRLGAGVALVSAGSNPHLRGDQRRRGVVLGRQCERPARRRYDDGLVDTGGSNGARKRCGKCIRRDPYSCAVASAGAVWCWGSNYYGQLGTGTTTDHHAPMPAVGFGSLVSDLNGDARSDVVWRHATLGQVWSWHMSAGVPVSQDYLATVAETGWQIVGLGDQTGDGNADLLWRHQSSGELFLWTMNGATVAAQQYIGAVAPEYSVVGHADFTGDGRADILWRHSTTGDLWLWEMNGATLVAPTRVGSVAVAYQVVASGDVDGDGRADIIWRHQTNGDVWVWLMNGAVLREPMFMGVVVDLQYRVAGLADFNRNGKMDILWRHETTGEVWLWEMTGTTLATILHVGAVGDVQYRVAGTGDYDGDGKADILWHHALLGDLWVWKMDGASIVSASRVATVPDVGYQVVTPR